MTASNPPIEAKRVPMRLSGWITQETVLAFTIVFLSLAVGLINPNFISERNISDILYNSSYIAVAALGMSLVIVSGNIDISVGSLIGLLATIGGRLAIGQAEGGYPEIVAFIVPIVIGVASGAVTGFFVAYLRVPAIVVSLGMLSILKGGLILWTGGEWIYNLPRWFQFAQERPLGLPAPLFFMVILTILMALWMRYSATGRAIYAVGGNKEAARLSGLSEKRIIMTVFMINGFMVGIAALLFAGQFNAIQSTVPPGVELLIITAAVVGGVSILGGTGTVVGATLGAILIHIIPSAMIFANVSSYWRGAVQGLLILLTVLVDLYRRRRQSYSGRG
ncbi:MAG: ABC transporter permease [Chloroflexota bacterium]|nr:ABC transporter permease [Chloroflexota bacterium]